MIILNKADQPRKTVIVMGVARSGTSLATQTLYNLGVFMGEKLSEGSYEDLAFAEQVKSNSKDLKATIEQRNAAHETWGFKLTSAFTSASEVMSEFERPLIITPIRDFVAVLKRRKMAKDKSLEDLFGRYVKQQTELFDFLTESNAPQFVYSHRDATENPKAFVQELVSAIGLSVDDAVIDKCVDSISAQQNQYTGAFFKNHSAKFDSEEEVLNSGRLELHLKEQPAEAVNSAWGLDKYDNKNAEDFIRPTVRNIRRHLTDDSKALNLVVDDYFQLSKSNADNATRLWAMREVFSNQERLIRVLFKRQLQATLFSLEKLESEKDGDLSKENIAKRMDNARSSSESENLSGLRYNVLNEFGHVSGWVVDVHNREQQAFDVLVKDEKIAEIKNDQNIKTRESKLLGVSNYGVSFRVDKTHAESELVLVPKGGTDRIKVKVPKQPAA